MLKLIPCCITASCWTHGKCNAT